MIKNLLAGGHIIVNGGYHNYPYIGVANGSGMVRWNSNVNEIEVNDGAVWRKLAANDTTIGLSPEAESAIEWAIQRQREEAELETRMQRHPGLRDSYEKFKIMEALTREEDAGQLNS
ncbi:MAG: hypothetical protein EBT86_11715 [Actinobacteria bacterium]|nr:hypothetical protein [Actinomycetota bacterium]